VYYISFVRLIGILSVTGVYYSTLFLLNNMGSSSSDSSDSKDGIEWYKCVGGSLAITAGVFCCVCCILPLIIFLILFFTVLGRTKDVIDSVGLYNDDFYNSPPSYGGYNPYGEDSMGTPSAYPTNGG